VQIDRRGTVDPKTGDVTISGIVTCSREVPVELFGEVEQRIGRSIGIARFFIFLETCDGETRWTTTTSSDIFLFVGGRAGVSATGFAGDPITGEFVFDETSRTVLLRGSK
jgi:hypothetical protein